MYQDKQTMELTEKKITNTPIIKEETLVDKCADKRKDLFLPEWWKLNEDCSSQKYIPMSPLAKMGSRDDRVIELFEGFGYDAKQATDLWDVYRSAGRIGRIRGEFLVCITYADSSLGKALLTTNNP